MKQSATTLINKIYSFKTDANMPVMDQEILGHRLLELYKIYQSYGIGKSKLFARVMREKMVCESINSVQLYESFKLRFSDWLEAAYLKSNASEDFYFMNLTSIKEYSEVIEVINEMINDLCSIAIDFVNHEEPASEKKSEKNSEKKADPNIDDLIKIAENNNGLNGLIIPEINHDLQPIEMKTEVISEKKEQRAKASFELNLNLAEIVEDSVRNYIDGSDILKNIQKYIKEEAQKLQPNLIMIGERKVGQIEGTLHHCFDDLLHLANIERNVFLAGPAGTGKTTLADQLAKAFSLPFAHISCTAGMSESHLLGRLTAHGDYLESDFVRIFENGGVFLFDEVDAADTNTLLVINSALANGVMSVPNRIKNQIAKKHKDFYCICAANTWGSGSIEYAGRASLDGAFLDRFTASKIFVDYDTKLEEKIAAKYPQHLSTIWEIRKKTQEQKIRKIVSTRAVAGMVRALDSGKSINDFLAVFFLGWSKEEKNKVHS